MENGLKAMLALSFTNSFVAALWALRDDSLIFAKELGLNNIIVELDALSVVHLLKQSYGRVGCFECSLSDEQ